MSKGRKRHSLPTRQRFVCRVCGQHDQGAVCPEKPVKASKGRTKGEAKTKAVRPSPATSEPFVGTETSLMDGYAAKAALGIIGSDQ